MKFILRILGWVRNTVSIILLAVLAFVLCYSVALATRIIDPNLVTSTPESLDPVASFLFSFLFILNPDRFGRMMQSIQTRISSARI
jgi:hypothetical protein